jgi:hypothetical protein
MLIPEHRNTAEHKPSSGVTAKVAAQAQLFRNRSREFFPGNKQDLLRALVMREVLGEPKCKQSSSRKQF